MATLRFQLDAGRYHATPWGRHVNEGAIEWPPSPWRLYRALLATGHRKLGWERLPDTGRSLFEKLCRTTPVWWLPPATSAHTRHYMPDFRGGTDRVIDAFAFVDRAPLYAEFAAPLSAQERDVLAELVRQLSYLGRAESWVSGELVEDPSQALADYFRISAGSRPVTAESLESVRVLGTLSPEDYLVWRQQRLDLELERQLVHEQETAAKKGKNAPSALSKKGRQGIEALLPATITDALYAETSDLLHDGWSQPPGTCWITYWLPSKALSSRAASPRSVPRPPVVQAVLFALSSDTSRGEVLPPFKDALLRGELFHAAAVRRATRHSRGAPSPILTGKSADGEPLTGHAHLHYTPLCLHDESRRGGAPSRRRIDHILAWSREPMDASTLDAISHITDIYHRDMPKLFVTVVGTGTLDDFRPRGRNGVPSLGTARVWVSSTPFVPPRFLKASSHNSLQGQVNAELTSRGLPTPLSVEVELEEDGRTRWMPGESFWRVWRSRETPLAFRDGDDLSPRHAPMLAGDWRHFRRERLLAPRRPPIACAVGLRLTFASEVSGPVAIGYGSHFGLGNFVPE